jgi:TonB family protein
VRDLNKNVLAPIGDGPMKLEVDLNNAPATLTFPMLEDMLFFRDAAAAESGLPIPIAEILPANANEVPKSRCDCKRILDGGQWVKLAKNDPHLVNPNLKSSAEPQFSDDARRKKISGLVGVVIYVNNAGHVEDVWLASPLGFGLDEKAVKAVRQYVFEPATYEGRRVGLDLVVEVNFQTF